MENEFFDGYPDLEDYMESQIEEVSEKDLISFENKEKEEDK